MRYVDSRSGLEAMDEDECLRRLAADTIGRLAVIAGGAPMIFPVNYVLDGNDIVFRTAPGTKLLLAGVDAPVVFEIDEASKLFESGTSVMVHGNLQEVVDPAERERLSWLPLRTWAPGDRDHYLRIAAHSVTGRRIGPAHADEGLGADGG